MPGYKKEKLEELVRDLAAEFLNETSNRASLLTVTGASFADNLQTAVVRFTVLPEEKEEEALDFLRRRRSDFRDYVKAKSRIMRLPRFDFEIDRGEKNRRRIDELQKEL